MDRRTLDVYQEQAETIFARLTTTNRATQFDRLRQWLLPGEPTADVGSGSGMVLAWLTAQGLPSIGYEPVVALRTLTMESYPDLEVRDASLPDLAGVSDDAFGNVVCSAVLMHLPLESISLAIANLARILRPGGRLILTYRRSRGGEEREDDGRLFIPIPPELLDNALRDSGMTVLHRSQNEDQSRPGVVWTEIVADTAATRATFIASTQPLGRSRGYRRG